MKRSLVGLALLASLASLGGACGSVARPGDASVRPAGATPSATAVTASALVFVVKPGADPQAVGHRIAGPSVTVTTAYPNSRPRDNLPMGAVIRSFTIPVAPDQAQELLRRARADPGVQQAYLTGAGASDCTAHDPAC